MQNVLDQLTKSGIQLLIKAPFYGHLFSALLKVASTQTESLATAPTSHQTTKLLVNAAYWEQISSPALRVGAIKHQLLHLIFGHHLQFKRYRHRPIFDLAADLVVQQYLNTDQIPVDAPPQNLLADLGFEQGAGLAEVYQNILAISHKNKASPILKWLEKDSLYFKQHDSWSAFGRLSTLEQERIEHTIHEAIMRSISRLPSHTFEQLPAGLKMHLNTLQHTRQPQIDWRRELRLFAKSNLSSSLKNTIHRPSKRYGTTPGSKIKTRQKLLVVIDTSASVKQEKFQVFFDEVHYLWKSGVHVYILECDTSIHKQYEYKGEKIPTITGRGGTDFTAPIRFTNERYHTDGLLYFTDGQADVPEVASRFPMLWVMATGEARNLERWMDFPGRVVFVN